jgi:hypothetical protein
MLSRLVKLESFPTDKIKSDDLTFIVRFVRMSALIYCHWMVFINFFYQEGCVMTAVANSVWSDELRHC